MTGVYETIEHPVPMKYQRNDTLMKALRADVDAYFEETGLSRGDQPAMWAKAIFILSWLWASYFVLLFAGLPAAANVAVAVSLGLAMAGVGFNIMHDGGHGAFSKSKVANRWLFRTLDMMGASSWVWKHQHNRAHHSYTNLAGHDEDIETDGMIRMSPQQEWRPHHRFQHFYSWILYGFLVPKWVFYDDFAILAKGVIGSTKVRPPKGAELAVFIGGKLLAITFVFVIPLILFPVWNVLGIYAITATVAGVTLAIVFQLAHAVDGTAFPSVESDRMSSTFSEHQLATTSNFAPHNRLLTWYVGGLNFQVEHHLFPTIAHAHYPALARIVRERAEREGVPHLSHPTFFAAIRAHYRHLKSLGRPADGAVAANV